jgi:hypothetical protein
MREQVIHTEFWWGSIFESIHLERLRSEGAVGFEDVNPVIVAPDRDIIVSKGQGVGRVQFIIRKHAKNFNYEKSPDPRTRAWV